MKIDLGKGGAVVDLVPSHVLVAWGEEIIRVSGKPGALVCVFSASGKAGGCLFIRDANAFDQVDPLVRLVAQMAKVSARTLSAKIVGEASFISRVRQRLTESGVTIAAVKQTRGARIEAFFFTGSGRLRLSEGHGSPLEKLSVPDVSAGIHKVRVLIVDDAKVIRDLLRVIIEADPTMVVVAEAADPREVEQLIIEHRPNVMTLDLEMPHMDGATLLKRLLPVHWLPAVVVTSLGMPEGARVLEAMEAGAVDYVQKPVLSDLPTLTPVIQEKLRAAASIDLRKARSLASRRRRKLAASGEPWNNRIVAIGSSTGGPDALKFVLAQLPEQIPPIVIAQHMPPAFSTALAKHLQDLCSFPVTEASDGAVLVPGHVYLAPGGRQMEVETVGQGKFRIRVHDNNSEHRHKPSVDVLFSSVARHCGAEAVGILLTGMGADGAKGLLEMRRAGARTVAQDEASCVIFGMPREAILIGAAEQVAPLDDVPQLILELASGRRAA